MQTVIRLRVLFIWTLEFVTTASALAQTYLGKTWKREAELPWFLDVDPTDRLFGRFKNDSFVTVRLAKYL